mmetsp:Transcript_45704/g.74554  ORF Transcript_45704/g.74554 Transcript_45704/m.74554 type:complete len:883 (-) Transcript_45704:235-2883(-)
MYQRSYICTFTLILISASVGFGHFARPLVFESKDGKIYANDNPFVIKGTTWHGFETPQFLGEGLGIVNIETIATFVEQSQFNTVVLPLSVEGVLTNPKVVASESSPLRGQRLFDVVEIALDAFADHDLLSLISFGRLAVDERSPSSLWYNDMFDPETVEVAWVRAAQQFCDQPNVFGVILHQNLQDPASWGDGNVKTDWKMAAESIANRILNECPRWLILVPGIGGFQSWRGANLRNAEESPLIIANPLRLVYAPQLGSPSMYYAEQVGGDEEGIFWEMELNYGWIPRETGRAIVISNIDSKDPQDKQWEDFVFLWAQKQSVGMVPFSLSGGLVSQDWERPHPRRIHASIGMPHTKVSLLHRPDYVKGYRTGRKLLATALEIEQCQVAAEKILTQCGFDTTVATATPLPTFVSIPSSYPVMEVGLETRRLLVTCVNGPIPNAVLSQVVSAYYGTADGTCQANNALVAATIANYTLGATFYFIPVNWQRLGLTSNPCPGQTRILSVTLTCSAPITPTPQPTNTLTALGPQRTSLPVPSPSRLPSFTNLPPSSSTALPSQTLPPSRTLSPSSSATVLVTVTPLPSNTRTASPLSTLTVRATRSPLPSNSRTPSRTSSNLPSSTRTPRTPSQLSSVSRTSSRSPSSTRTPSRSPSVTRTPSRSPSVTRTPSRSPSVTRTPSRSPSVTRSPSRSSSTTRTPSRSPSETRSPSRSPSTSQTVSRLPSTTRTVSRSPSVALSTPVTPSRSVARSPSLSRAPLRTPTVRSSVTQVQGQPSTATPPPVPTPLIACGANVENGSLTLSCASKPNSVISSIRFASFGRPVISLGCAGYQANPLCHAPDSAAVVGLICLGKPSCRFQTRINMFAPFACNTVLSKRIAVVATCS